MAKLQEPLKAIKEKYKDDPKRVQQETMKIYSEYGINPLAGCLPVLIQIPIFIGLYYMLQTSCEIRFAHFLWINDLSLPDTIESLPSIFGIPLHILPLLNAGVTFFQMHLTPSPSTDKTQAMMLKLMPVIMLVFFYTYTIPRTYAYFRVLSSCMLLLREDTSSIYQANAPDRTPTFHYPLPNCQLYPIRTASHRSLLLHS